MISFFLRLRKEADKRRRRLTVDFTKIERLSPASGLVLASEVDRWRLVKGVRLRTVDIESWDPTVRGLLQQLGFFELLEVQEPELSYRQDTGSLQFIRFKTSTDTEGALAKELREALEQVIGPIETRRFLYRGLTEAMNNAIQHAYPLGFHHPFPVLERRWWMCGSFDRDEDTMTVLFIDQGVGIPATIPRSKHWEKVRGVLHTLGISRHDDANLIKAAVELGRSSTELEGRGYGLSEIRRFIENSLDGRLRILSGRGEYTYTKGGEVSLRRHSYPLGGTLIEWEVRRPAAADPGAGEAAT